jgi:dTDP-4-dehydrorhamnose 3,5-epimerase
MYGWAAPRLGSMSKVSSMTRIDANLWVPRGFAHGYLVLSEAADLFYKRDDYYSPSDELVLKWNDPALSIDWGIAEPQLPKRDQDGVTLANLSPKLPSFS